MVDGAQPIPDEAATGGQVEAREGAGAGLTVMFTGGGTGGHVNPGLAVASELRRLRPGVRIVWVGTADRLEARLVPRAGIPIEFIRVSFLKGRGALGKLRSLVQIPRSLWQSRRLLRRHRPQVVVGVGGFASGPVTLWAALTRRATAILEQNARPGLTNRLLGRVVKRVFTAFEETGAWFRPAKVRQVGNPVRGELIAEPSADRPADGTVRLLVIGGSQGARSLNLDLPGVLSAVSEAGVALAVRHAAGRGRVAEVEAAYAAVEPIELGGRSSVEIVDYIDDMGAAYGWADLVICRAGASTVAELTALGKAAVYVPFPAAADNHQERNAQAIVERGGGLLVRDAELREAPPVESLVELLGDPERLRAMERAARDLGRPEAARRIAEEVLRMAGEEVVSE